MLIAKNEGLLCFLTSAFYSQMIKNRFCFREESGAVINAFVGKKFVEIAVSQLLQTNGTFHDMINSVRK